MEDGIAILETMNRHFQELVARLDRLERLQSLGIVKEGYTVRETAERLGRDEYTGREEWCNQGRIRAYKVRGKGRTGEWRVPADELARVEAEGPSPAGTFDNLRLPA